MRMNCQISKMIYSFVISTTVFFPVYANAAEFVNLLRQPVSLLNDLFFKLPNQSELGLREINRKVDFNHTLHVYAQETYRSYPIQGSGTILHIPHGDKTMPLSSLVKLNNGFMTGFVFQHLNADLNTTSEKIFSSAQLELAIKKAISLYPNENIINQRGQLMVDVDKNHQAHWVFNIELAIAEGPLKIKNVDVILDAERLQINQNLKSFSKITPSLKNKKTSQLAAATEMVKAGGIGGNEKTGTVYYDGLPGHNHLASVWVARNPLTKTCYLKDEDITVRDWNKDLDVVEFPCEKPDPTHNNLYWNAQLDKTNGAYNPAMDIFYVAQLTRDMLKTWQNASLWIDQGIVKKLNFFVHSERSYFEDGAWFSLPDQVWYVALSDGNENQYPWSMYDVVANLIGEGYKKSHGWYAWGGGELPATCIAFNDLFTQAVEFYATGKNNWTIGRTVVKDKVRALRYMRHPTLDCEGRKPGDHCSIDNATTQFDPERLEGYYAAGVLNKAYYLLSTSPGWDTKKTFEVMTQANAFYWQVPERPWDFKFEDVACGMMYAANDYHYDTQALVQAFSNVGVHISQWC